LTEQLLTSLRIFCAGLFAHSQQTLFAALSFSAHSFATCPPTSKQRMWLGLPVHVGISTWPTLDPNGFAPKISTIS
jgi:hypothetical protein